MCQPLPHHEMIERFNSIDLTHWTRPNRILKKLNKGCRISKMNIEDNLLILTFMGCSQRLSILWIHQIGPKLLEAKSLRSITMIQWEKSKINKRSWIIRASMLCYHQVRMTSPMKKSKPRRRSWYASLSIVSIVSRKIRKSQTPKARHMESIQISWPPALSLAIHFAFHQIQIPHSSTTERNWKRQWYHWM